MINIDWKGYFRSRVWFGFECNSIMHESDGKVRGDWIRPIYVDTKKDRARHQPWWIFKRNKSVEFNGGHTHYDEVTSEEPYRTEGLLTYKVRND